MRLLLAEDDDMLGSSMQKALKLAGFQVDWVKDGAAVLSQVADSHDALLLDLGLPELDGLQVLQALRQRGQHLPVLIVSARQTVEDRISGLNRGADDYITKPFDLNELIARLHALIRRNQGRSQPVLNCGTLQLDPIRREAWLAGQGLELSQREFDLLEHLMERPGTVLSREQLEARLYGWQEEVASNAIEVHLHHLRRKLGSDWIKNVRGVGYKLVDASAARPAP
jgi:two-component system response regulator QseB